MFETRAHECMTYWPLCVCNVTDSTTTSLGNYEAGSFLYETMADNNCFDRRDNQCFSSFSHSTMRLGMSATLCGGGKSKANGDRSALISPLKLPLSNSKELEKLLVSSEDIGSFAFLTLAPCVLHV